MDLSTIHILESGDHHHFMQTLFERIHLLWTYRQRPKSCLAALVSNYAAIVRHQPQEDGVHAIYYACEGGGLSCRAIESALVDKDRLRRIAVGGRAHVRANHASPASASGYCARHCKMKFCTATTDRPSQERPMQSYSDGRILFDISTSMRWVGPPAPLQFAPIIRAAIEKGLRFG